MPISGSSLFSKTTLTICCNMSNTLYIIWPIADYKRAVYESNCFTMLLYQQDNQFDISNYSLDILH